MFRLFKMIKDLMWAVFLVAFVLTALSLYSLFSNEDFKQSCRELGVKCEANEVVDTAKKAKNIFQNVLQKIKSIDW